MHSVLSSCFCFAVQSRINQSKNYRQPRSGYLQLYTRNSRAIRLDEHRVVEEGCNVLERDIMNFIAVNAITPVSKTYKIKFVEVRKTFYIVIDYMHGEPLDKAWMNMLVDEAGQVTAVFGWEWAGRFPEYWDAVRIFIDMLSTKQMPEYANLLLSVLPNQCEEYLAMVYIVRLEAPDQVGRPFIHQLCLNEGFASSSRFLRSYLGSLYFIVRELF
ncbi:hypothetical protein BDDG_02151 [Blastomyces dermatitidis ATCC 18188]|uniref:Uncharacterized protein n=2 Tax=Ajellomyces dermatitidis TaxID=5039 RepID=F2T7K0_AJEDA|nr:hypothetical protein BDDG_02151 [Blastomyces dermatitidis ATCC 18188]